MSRIIDFIIRFFKKEPFCPHINTEWFLIDIGRNKAEFCKDCGKLLRTLDKDFR